MECEVIQDFKKHVFHSALEIKTTHLVQFSFSSQSGPWAGADKINVNRAEET